MRRGQLVLVEDLTVCGLPAVESRPVPRGDAGLHLVTSVYPRLECSRPCISLVLAERALEHRSGQAQNEDHHRQTQEEVHNPRGDRPVTAGFGSAGASRCRQPRRSQPALRFSYTGQEAHTPSRYVCAAADALAGSGRGRSLTSASANVPARRSARNPSSSRSPSSVSGRWRTQIQNQRTAEDTMMASRVVGKESIRGSSSGHKKTRIAGRDEGGSAAFDSITGARARRTVAPAPLSDGADGSLSLGQEALPCPSRGSRGTIDPAGVPAFLVWFLRGRRHTGRAAVRLPCLVTLSSSLSNLSVYASHCGARPRSSDGPWAGNPPKQARRVRLPPRLHPWPPATALLPPSLRSMLAGQIPLQPAPPLASSHVEPDAHRPLPSPSGTGCLSRRGVQPCMQPARGPGLELASYHEEKFYHDLPPPMRMRSPRPP